MTNVIQDVSTLTTIPLSSLQKLVGKGQDCICHSVYESILNNEEVTELDIGIGTLYIQCNSEEARYKFIPSLMLEKQVRETAQTRESPVILNVEEKLKDKIMYVYKDLY
jgi:hypothetical protein